MGGGGAEGVEAGRAIHCECVISTTLENVSVGQYLFHICQQNLLIRYATIQESRLCLDAGYCNQAEGAYYLTA